MRTLEEEKQIIQQVLGQHLASFSPSFRVLEAGCGSAIHVSLPSSAVVDGIDISQKQLARNARLTERIHGDLQTYELPKEHYQIVICWDVLEHLPNPEKALRKLFTTADRNGLILLAMPNVHSFEGQITKWTPLWFHVWVLKYVFNNKLAGKDDLGPFKTYFHRAIALDAIEALSSKFDLEVYYRSNYSRSRILTLKERSRILYFLFMQCAKLTQFLSGGKIEPVLSSSIIILHKKG